MIKCHTLVEEFFLFSSFSKYMYMPAYVNVDLQNILL